MEIRNFKTTIAAKYVLGVQFQSVLRQLRISHQCQLKSMEKKIKVLGGIGKTERMNRDRYRVFYRGGVAAVYVLTIHKSRSW